MNMASIRSIRKLHQEQMAVTVAVRKVMKYWGEGSVKFTCVADAVAYLRDITAEIDRGALPMIHYGEAVLPTSGP